jgi:hypothetical protein
MRLRLAEKKIRTRLQRKRIKHTILVCKKCLIDKHLWRKNEDIPMRNIGRCSLCNKRHRLFETGTTETSVEKTKRIRITNRTPEREKRGEKRIRKLLDEHSSELAALVTLEPSFAFCNSCRSKDSRVTQEERNKMLVTLGEVAKELDIDFDGLWEWPRICERLLRWVKHREIEKAVQQEEKKQNRKRKRQEKTIKRIKRLRIKNNLEEEE